jgi:hypothetical protein
VGVQCCSEWRSVVEVEGQQWLVASVFVAMVHWGALVLRYVPGRVALLEQLPAVWVWMPCVAMGLRRVVQVC